MLVQYKELESKLSIKHSVHYSVTMYCGQVITIDEDKVWNKEVRPIMKNILTGVAISRPKHQELCRSWSNFVGLCKIPLAERVSSLLEEIFDETRICKQALRQSLSRKSCLNVDTTSS